MAGKGAVFKNDVLKLILNATPIANLADNAATSPLTNLYISLHTADPAAGDQTTSEVSYTGYARQALVRTTSGFSAASGGVATLASNVTFPTDSGGTQGTVTHIGIGTLVSGTGKLLWCGALSPNVVLAVGPGPILASGSTVTES
mgnify:CR=1 FL=1